MGNIIDLSEYRDSREVESKYLKFLSVVQKFFGIPKDIGHVGVIFYCILRYLEGTINAVGMLSVLGIGINRKHLLEFKQMSVNWLKDIIKEIESL